MFSRDVFAIEYLFIRYRYWLTVCINEKEVIYVVAIIIIIDAHERNFCF